MIEPQAPFDPLPAGSTDSVPPGSVPSGGSTGRSRYRPAIIASVIFHLVLLVVLLFWYLPAPSESTVDSPTHSAPVASDDASVTDRLPPASPPVPEPSPEVPPEQILASIESQFEQFKDLPDERKLSELEKNLKRLESLGNEESVQEVTTTIADSLGLTPGAVPADDAPEGKFDTSTAQLHDVSRKKNDAGGWDYETVLVDSQGRTETVALTPAEGEPIYQAFEQMKKFPMAAGIYRQVVMPLIQKTIEASEIAEKVAAEAERIQQDEQSVPES